MSKFIKLHHALANGYIFINVDKIESFYRDNGYTRLRCVGMFDDKGWNSDSYCFKETPEQILALINGDKLSGELEIDWSNVPDKYKWAAMEVDGSVWAYTKEPELHGGSWVSDSELEKIFFAPRNWENSLTKRPE